MATKVKIMFSGDITQIGKTRSVPDDEAATMVREGRAQYVADPPDDTEAVRAEQAKPAPTPAASPARP